MAESTLRTHPAFGYLAAGCAVAVAAAVTRIIHPYVAPTVLPVFLLAVAISTLLGGRGPGWLATLLGVAALGYWFIPPVGPDQPGDLARLLLFLVVATVIVGLAGAVRRHRASARGAEKPRERLPGNGSAAASAGPATQQVIPATRPAEEHADETRQPAREGELARGTAAAALAKLQETEAALRRSEAELADFFETASVGLHWAAADGTILRANQAELDMLGYRREEYVDHNLREFHVGPEVIEDILGRVVGGEKVSHYPARLRCKDGRVKDVVIDSSGYFQGGHFAHTRCLTRDVTAERHAQEAVARLAAIVTSSSDAIVGKTLDGVVTSWNSAAERIFGYSAAEMVGQSIFRLIPPEYHDAERDLLARLRAGEVVEFSEAERVRKDGTRIWISLSVSPVRDRSGIITGAASIKRDITERKLLDDRLRSAQRLQVVGQLAGGLAHEANNQMSVVLGGAHFLLRRPDLPEDARQEIEQIRQAAGRTAAITQQLLAVGRRQMLQLQDVNLNDVVQSIGPVLRRSLTEDQTLVVRLGLLGGMVRADPRQLEQVLLNLTLNARDAMPNGGRLTIETMEVQLGPGEAGRHGMPPGTYETLAVQDTGEGMDQSTLEHVFEPFFTTKSVGQGTGLGLSVVEGIVSQVGGQIRLESAPGRGTTFRLFFPMISPLQVAEPEEGHASHPPERGAVTLVVEDDPWVRAMAMRALADAGYRTLEAADGRAAMDLVRRHTGRLDLVLTDLGMPGMDGYELARCLEEERPGLPVVFMTGYGERDTRGVRSLSAAGPVLQKPFSPDVLVRAVGDALHVAGRRRGTGR